MNNPAEAHGLPWATHELRMDYPWTTDGLPMGMGFHGLSMGYVWTAHGPPMDCPWATHKLPPNTYWYELQDAWAVHRQPVISSGSQWVAHG